MWPKRKKNPKRKAPLKLKADRYPFSEHLQELRARLLYCAIAVLAFATAAYFVQEHLVSLLLKPAHNQHFIYTSPTGGIGFLFEICTDVGIILALPLIFYQFLRFIEPLLNNRVRRFVVRCALASTFLALIGVAFGYFLGLPLALHFLGHQFKTNQIQSLLTVSEYMSFLSIYLVGSAMLFQVPLILVIVNKIRPQPPRRLFHLERYVIAGAFIISMLMAPTVNLIDQLIIAGPLILAYQVGIAVVWWANRPSRTQNQVKRLLDQDRLAQAERSQRLGQVVSLIESDPVATPPQSAAVSLQTSPIAVPQDNQETSPPGWLSTASS